MGFLRSDLNIFHHVFFVVKFVFNVCYGRHVFERLSTLDERVPSYKSSRRFDGRRCLTLREAMRNEYLYVPIAHPVKPFCPPSKLDLAIAEICPPSNSLA